MDELATATKQEKKKKELILERKKPLCLFADDKSIYMWNAGEFT